MSTLTAQILIGRCDTYRYCIIPAHELTLHEGMRPTLVLRPYPVTVPADLPAHRSPPGEIHWTPTPSHILEDALLMIAVHALKVPQLVKLASRFQRMHKAEYLDLSAMDESPRLRLLRTRCREHFPSRCKLAITLFNDSSFFHSVELLRGYPMEVELCTPVFERYWHTFQEVVKEIGTLTIPSSTERDPAEDGNHPDHGLLAAIKRKSEVKGRQATRSKRPQK